MFPSRFHHTFSRDGWANGHPVEAASFAAQTGFERELLDLLRFLDTANVNNLVFITTDVHFAAHIRYAFDADGDGDALVFHELITGPPNAGAAPAVTQAQLDPTLNPTLLYADGGLFNFGSVRTQQGADGQTTGKVHLVAEVRGEDGRLRPGSHLDLPPY